MPSTEEAWVLFDAGVLIGALLAGDARHAEARPLVEAARRGDILACTTTGILSEVYAALTWQQAEPPHDPERATEAVRLLVEPPSMIKVLADGRDVALRMLELAASYQLRARRVRTTHVTRRRPSSPASSRCTPTTPMTGRRSRVTG